MKKEFKNAKVKILNGEDHKQPAIFITDNDRVYMVTITANHKFVITDEGLVGTRYDSDGNWCEDLTKLTGLGTKFIKSEKLECSEFEEACVYELLSRQLVIACKSLNLSTIRKMVYPADFYPGLASVVQHCVLNDRLAVVTDNLFSFHEFNPTVVRMQRWITEQNLVELLQKRQEE